jgi:hypothetical protein
MILPSYNSHSHALRQTDFETIMSCQEPGDLCQRIYSCEIENFLESSRIKQYLKTPAFRNGADYFETDDFISALSAIILKVHQTARAFGFPGQPTTRQGSKIDIALAKTVSEAFEQYGILVTPSQASSRFFQQFMTQRIFPLLALWRWKVVTGNNLSKDRISYSPRNYFYVLWVSGYLFDKGAGAQSERWFLLENMTSDSLVQIIERSGLGYRKGFAHAIAAERIRRSASSSGGVLDKLVRGCMKRASFTFATSIMVEDEVYYKKIAEYLFNWAESNYLPAKENKSET